MFPMCRYKNNETGRVNAVWPGSSLHYVELIKKPRWEDYDIEYIGPGKKNMGAFLGMGTVEALVTKGDPSPYLSVESIDPAWMKAMGMDANKLAETKIGELKAKQEKQEEKSKETVERTAISSNGA